MSKLDEYWFPWYPHRFETDTMHLSALQDGIYRRLIDHYMTTKSPLPNNHAALARIAGVSIEIFAQNSVDILKLFIEIKDEKATAKLQQSRCEAILADQAERRESYRLRGERGGRKKSNNNNPKKATAKLTPTTKTYTDTEREKKLNKEKDFSDDKNRTQNQPSKSDRAAQATARAVRGYQFPPSKQPAGPSDAG